jgi:peptidyl-prolyl cis-trans isomerase C
MLMNHQSAIRSFAGSMRKLSLPAVITGLLVAHVAQAQTLLQGPAATVTAEDVKAAAQAVPAASRDAVLSRPDQVQSLLQDLYLRRALAAEAERDGLDKDPLVAALLRLARDRVLSDARLAAIDRAATPPDAVLTANARDLYRAAPQRFQAPAQTRARHILISHSEDGKARELAEALLAQIKAGASFDALASQHSADLATANQGGELGWLTPGSMVKEFEEALAALKQAGDLSPVVETQFGFHIIRLDERRAAGLRPFDEVRPEIEQEIRTRVQLESRRVKVRELLDPVTPDSAAVEAFSNTFRRR